MVQQKRKRRNMRSAKRAALRRKRKRQVLFGLILVCILFVWGISYFLLYRSVSKYPKDKICDNIYIGSVNVSGMTKEKAVKELEKHLQEDGEIKATLKVQKKSVEVSLADLGLNYGDVEKVAQKAVDYGKKGSVAGRYFKLRKLKKEKVVFDKSIALKDKTAKSVVKEKAVPLASHAVDASITIEESGPVITEAKEGKTVDIPKSIDALEQYLNTEWKHKDFSIKMVMKKEQPKVKEKDLQSITDELGSFSTDAGGGERWKNLKTGAEMLNGTVLMPGEEASVHDLTAPYDGEHGYVPAGSYENGQVVDSYGGGICQVSTTLYNALLYSEVEITKRYPHSMLINYVEPSRDAAIAGDTKDLKFKNNYDTPIYIHGGIDDNNQLTFAIYGKETRPENRKIKLVSETTKTEEYSVTYKTNSEAAIGSMEYTGSPHIGKTARLWKVIYEDGEEVGKEQINDSYYKKSDQIIEVGIKSDNPEASALVKNAVATQDKDKINAAIAQASAI